MTSRTISTWLKCAADKLTIAGIGTARLDALVLLEDISGKERSWLLAHPEFELDDVLVKKLDTQIARRAGHEPLAYIRNKTEFYGREFYIDHRVLEPRPESETMIDLLKELPLTKNSRIADIGTGSGALGITAKLETPNLEVDLIELDSGAIEVAKKNVAKFATNISVLQSDLLASSTKSYDILLCNLPYVPDDFHINPAAMAEPSLAIFGGLDGLDVYRKLFSQIKSHQRKPLYILCESMPPQHDKLARIARASNYKLEETDDFIQVYKHLL